jgi:SAM-dependent methyltransferase
MFRSTSVATIQRHFPAFSGEPFIHNLQSHIVDRVLDPLLDRHVKPGGVALDLGCGSGTMVKRMADRGATAIGIDLEGGAFDKHEELTVLDADDPNTVLGRPGGYLLEGDICRVPLRDGVADFVTSRWVFEHLSDPADAIREIGRLLKPGGIALLVVPNKRHPGMMLSTALPLGVKQRLLFALNGIEEDLVFPTYYRANTEADLDRQFHANGFGKVELHYLRDPSYWLFSDKLFRAAVTAGKVAQRLPLRRFRMHILGVYRKPEL